MTQDPSRGEPDEPPPSEMPPSETPPSADELQAMAYADGEMPEGDRAAFVERLRSEPALLRLVAEHRALDVLSRGAAPPEPAELDWSTVRDAASYRAPRLLGWVLLGVAMAAGAALLVAGYLLDDGVPPGVRALVAAAVAGLTLLFSDVLRRRLRALPLDPYRNLER